MTRKKKQYYFIYKTTNILNGKYYIGMHSTNNLSDGYLGSGKRLRYSINKYGIENHKREIIEFCESIEELKNKEKEIVNLNEIAKKECINIQPGGGGGFTIEQQKENAIKSNQVQKKLRETNPEWVKKRSNNLSKSIKKAYDEGRKEKKCYCNWSGKKHKEESKKKIGKASSIHQKGEKNSQFGTCWITNGIENKKIFKNDLDLFINDNWKLGRIMMVKYPILL